MLALVAHSLSPVKRLGPCKRPQLCWPKTPNNTQQCCDLLRSFVWAFSSIALLSKERLILRLLPGDYETFREPKLQLTSSPTPPSY